MADDAYWPKGLEAPRAPGGEDTGTSGDGMDDYVTNAVGAAADADLRQRKAAVLQERSRVALRRVRKREANKVARDKARVRAIQSLGLTVIPVTAYDMADPARLDQAAWALFNCQHREDRRAGQNPEALARTHRLRWESMTALTAESARAGLLEKLNSWGPPEG